MDIQEIATKKILQVMERIKEKELLHPDGATINYRAGQETSLSAPEEIAILNRLASLGVIEVESNASSDFI